MQNTACDKMQPLSKFVVDKWGRVHAVIVLLVS